MNEKLHIELTIPKSWNGQQAYAVAEFLESIITAIWDVHGDGIIALIDAKRNEPQNLKQIQTPTTTEDYPF